MCPWYYYVWQTWEFNSGRFVLETCIYTNILHKWLSHPKCLSPFWLFNDILWLQNKRNLVHPVMHTGRPRQIAGRLSACERPASWLTISSSHRGKTGQTQVLLMGTKPILFRRFRPVFHSLLKEVRISVYGFLGSTNIQWDLLKRQVRGREEWEECFLT